MSVTPSKAALSLINNFKPSKELTTPNKDANCMQRTVFKHIEALHQLLVEWITKRISTTLPCKTITKLKSPKNVTEDCDYDEYPPELEPRTTALVCALDFFKGVVERMEKITKQLKAALKLFPSDSPVTCSWLPHMIEDEANRMLECLQKELQIKQIVTENIAHTTDKSLLTLYATAWDLEAYISVETFAYLFVEFGLSPLRNDITPQKSSPDSRH
ncbi:unnamed protein product [Plutella xylostella]|uniref:(diamondback moth) hypothetical protein n=1 Tax=Plutella xylostella TaxID=51655 RepID=A0A8S4DRH9_PLUXY|nr:unnamed protein product [Plutella xylostella]